MKTARPAASARDEPEETRDSPSREQREATADSARIKDASPVQSAGLAPHADGSAKPPPFLDPGLASPWRRIVARARDGKTTLAAGRLRARDFCVPEKTTGHDTAYPTQGDVPRPPTCGILTDHRACGEELPGGVMRLGAFLAVFALVTGCFADYVPPMPAYMAGAAPGRSFNADAPPGFDPRLLGVPRDANFHAAPGVGSLFPQAGPLVPVPVNRFNVDQKLVSTAEELAANAQAWAVDFNLSSLRRQRYAYFRPVPWTTAWELQPGGSMLQPPPWAVYYASKVYLGRSYVEIIEGDASIFDARAGMQFLQAPVGASISQYASDHHLTSHRAGTGFVPVGAGSMFARTEQDILQNYRPDGPEIAVAIEYTQLPRTQPNGALLFPDPKTVTVRFVSLDVGAPGAMFTDASTWTMTGDCTVNGQSDAGPQRFLAERVRLGQFPLTFMRTVVAADGDQLVCSAQGTYSRGLGGEPHSLGPSTTGPITVGVINGLMTSRMLGRDAETNYAITWTAAKTP